MKVEVLAGIEELKRQFGTSTIQVREDRQGGAYVIVEPVTIGPRYRPKETWVGFQIPAQYPYALFSAGQHLDISPHPEPVPGNTTSSFPSLSI